MKKRLDDITEKRLEGLVLSMLGRDKEKAEKILRENVKHYSSKGIDVSKYERFLDLVDYEY